MRGQEASVSICQQHFPESAVVLGEVTLKLKTRGYNEGHEKILMQMCVFLKYNPR